MYQKINFSDFVTAFRNHGRQDQFSYDAQRLLFDYLEEREDDTGVDVELDVIALCCEYKEASVPEVIEQYDVDIVDAIDEEEEYAGVMKYLEDHTTVIGETCVNTILFAEF